jgi:hypothetical protein
MSDFLFEGRIERAARDIADEAIRPIDAVAIAETAIRAAPRQRTTRRLAWRLPHTRARAATVGIVVVVIAVLAVGGAFYVNRPDRSAVGGPSATPGITSSRSNQATPTASPSPTPTPLLWTPASLQEDWPAPVRAEPAGGAIVQPILVKHIMVDSHTCCLVNEPGRYVDPTGDTGSDGVPWLDISEVTVGTYGVIIKLASNQMPDVEPTEQWIAYGVVFDDDRDGAPDRRFGIDNVQPDPEHRHRTWMTDLHTGRTLVSDGAHIGSAYIDTFFPDELRDGGAEFSFGGNIAGGGTAGMELDHRPFYVWASVIQDGRVVATDYAPDVGWLQPSVQTKP